MGTAPHSHRDLPTPSQRDPPALRMYSHLPTATASTFACLMSIRTPAREQLTGPRNLGLMPPYEGTRYRHQALPPQGPDACARRGGQRRQSGRGEAQVEGLGQTRRRAARGLGARRRVAGLGDRPGTDAAIRTDWADLSARAATRCTSSARPWSSSSESRYARYRFMPTPSFWPSRFVVVKQNTSCR